MFQETGYRSAYRVEIVQYFFFFLMRSKDWKEIRKDWKVQYVVFISG